MVVPSELPKVEMSPGGPSFSAFVQGYWRMSDWQRSPQEHLSFLNQHIELGVTTVDHAHVYGNPSCETLFGEALKLSPSLRDKIEIITKCGIDLISPDNQDEKVNHYNSSREAVLSSVDLSLSRLGVESVDVLLIHRPDYLMELDELAEAFDTLKQAGKVQHFGVSNFSDTQYASLQSRLDSSLVTNQVEINPLNTAVLDDGTLDQLQTLRVRPMGWSCLAGGRFFSEESEQIVRTKYILNKVAEEIGADSIDQVLFAWARRLPSKPVPIIGSGNIERVRSAVASQSLTLTNEQWYRIWVAAKGHGVP